MIPGEMARLGRRFKPLTRRMLRGPLMASLTVLALLVSSIAPAAASVSAALVVGTTLKVTGSSFDEAISLRLMLGDPAMLEVDYGDDGTADDMFARTDFVTIELDGGGGNDELAIDEANGVFTDMESTTIIGGAGEDFLVAGSGPETLLGGTENDRLFGGPSGDSIQAEAGDDFVDGEGGNDNINGGEGQDTLWGAEDNDIVTGGEGVDLLDAAFDLPNETTTTNDSLSGGPGNDRLRGGTGDDTLAGGLDNDSVSGDQGTDRIHEEGGSKFRLTNNSLVGLGLDHVTTIEHATLVLHPSGSELDASAFGGSVVLVGNDLKNSLRAGPGDDRLEAGGGDDSVIGGAGNDFMSGGTGWDELSQPGDASFTLSDVALTGLGTDAISGFEAATFIGGPSANVMDASGFSGRVSLLGEAGNDRLLAGASRASLDGGAGDDELVGSDARDYLWGGDGNDVLWGSRGNDVLQGREGDDTITGGSGRDYIDGKDGNDRLLGGRGKDKIWGGSDIDILVGGLGPDIMHGGRANDRIFAKDGDRDTLRGGRGFDRAIVDDEDEVFAVERFGRR